MKAVLLALALFGCADLSTYKPGHITTTKSQYDGTEEVKLNAAAVKNNTIGVGLWRSSKMKTDNVFMEVTLTGIEAFAEGKSLHIKIDGIEQSFSSNDDQVDCESGASAGYAWSACRRKYSVPISIVSQMAKGKEVLIKVDRKKTYSEDSFTAEGQKHFAVFLEHVEKSQGRSTASEK